MNPRMKIYSREERSATADSLLSERLANPEAAAAADAAQQEINRLAEQEQEQSTASRIEALAAEFGEWAVVADVLRSEGLTGEQLISELLKCKKEAPSAAAWMLNNF